MKERDKKLYACVDVHITENQKIARAGKHLEAVGWLHLAGITYSKRNNTDGFIPLRVAQMLTPSAKKLIHIISNLCELWEKTDEGFRIHHYTEWQETSDEIEAKRLAKIEAGRAGGTRSGISRSKAANSNTTKQKASKNEAGASNTGSKNEAGAFKNTQAKTKQNEAYEDEDEVLKKESSIEDAKTAKPVCVKKLTWGGHVSAGIAMYQAAYKRRYGGFRELVEGEKSFLGSKHKDSVVKLSSAIDNFFGCENPVVLAKQHSVFHLRDGWGDVWLELDPGEASYRHWPDYNRQRQQAQFPSQPVSAARSAEPSSQPIDQAWLDAQYAALRDEAVVN